MTPGLAVHGQEARFGLDHDVIAGPAGLIEESEEVHMDEPGVAFRQTRGVQSQSLQ